MCRLPLISVVITTYDQERYIGKVIESVLNQGVDDLELIILDDCSPDSTADVVAPYLSDKRIQYIRHAKNLGDKANNTLALITGKGKYRVLLHGDDYFMPGHLANYIDVMEQHPECALIYSPCYWVDESDRVIRIARHPGHPEFDYAGGRNEVAELLASDNYITPSAAMFRRSDLEAIDNLNPDIKGSDWDLFVRLAIHNRNFAYLCKPSTAYRISDSQGSNKFYASIEPLRTHLHVIDVAFGSSASKTLWEYGAEISRQLEQRISQYSAEDLEPLEKKIDKARQQLGTISSDLNPGRCDDNPLVSVIVPTKDRPELLQDTLESVNAQGYSNWEVVVVNDGGVDVSAMVQVLDRFNRFRYICHDKSRGLSSARNTGIRFSNGDILCYLDDDDRFGPDHLETVVHALGEEGTDFVYTEADFVLEDVQGGNRKELSRSQPYSGIPYSAERLHVSNYIPVNTWAHRRKLLAHTGGFDPQLKALEDWDLLLRFARCKNFTRIPAVTVEVRVRETCGQQHMSQRERRNYPEIFAEIYARYDAGDNQTVVQARKVQLQQLTAERSGDSDADSIAVTAGELPLVRREMAYRKWRDNNRPGDSDIAVLDERMRNQWKKYPSVHFVLVDVQDSDRQLIDTLGSIASQLYSGWGVSVLSSRQAFVPEFESEDNLEWICTENIAAALAGVIEHSSTDWISFLTSGDRLEPDYLLSLLDLADVKGLAEVLYPDQDSISEDGEYYNVQFRPDMDMDLLRSLDFIGNGCLLNTARVQTELRDLSLQDSGYIYKLLLKVVEEKSEEGFAHDSKVLFHAHDQNRSSWYSASSGSSRQQYLDEHLHRVGLKATVHCGYLADSHRVEYLHNETPMVSIIIPTRDASEVLETCVSTLLDKTLYRNYEVIIVDNNSEKPETLRYLEVVQKNNQQVRVLEYAGKYNYSAINNFAVEKAKGEYIVLLNNDTAILKGDWLLQMLSPGQRKDTGIVGARLLFPNNTVQHAGIVTGLLSAAEHPHIGLPASESGYMGQILQMRGVSAVTAACFLIRKSVFLEVGGLNEEDFEVLYNDVDLCLRVRQAGYRVVYTPYAVLMHHGSFSLKDTANNAGAKSRGTSEHRALLKKWLPVLANDRFYNPNLSLADNSVQPETGITTSWDLHRHDRLRILAFPPDAWAVGDYRVLSPLSQLEENGRLRCAYMPEHAGDNRIDRPLMPVELERCKADVLLMHQALHDYHLQAMEQFSQLNQSVLRVFGMDDLLDNPPPGHRLHKAGYRDIKRRIRKALSLSDRLIVSTQPLADAYSDMIDDVRVVPNAIDMRRWSGLASGKRTGSRMRVGWAGGNSHQLDLQILVPVIEQLADEVDWVFLGSMPQGIEGTLVEFHEAVAYPQYPEKLASLNLDLALSPLTSCPFNEAKSNLRILEYGILGIPAICSDIKPFRNAPVTRVRNTAKAWVKAIRDHANDFDETERLAMRLRDWVVSGYQLEQHAEQWLESLSANGTESGDSIPGSVIA